jgi:DNA-binding MarR family transcriptional regulator
MNIEQVAKSAKTTTITVTKHLSRLAQKGTVREYPCGRNRVFVATGGAIV